MSGYYIECKIQFYREVYLFTSSYQMWPEFKDWWEQNNLECSFPLDLLLTPLSSVSNPFEKELGGTETINEGPFSELGYRILWGTECQMEMHEKTGRKEKQRGHMYLFHSPRPCSFSRLHDKFRDLLIFLFFSALACWPALVDRFVWIRLIWQSQVCHHVSPCGLEKYCITVSPYQQ